MAVAVGLEDGVPLGVGLTGTGGLGDADEGAVEGVPVGDAPGDVLDEAAGVAVADPEGVLAGAGAWPWAGPTRSGVSTRWPW